MTEVAPALARLSSTRGSRSGKTSIFQFVAGSRRGCREQIREGACEPAERFQDPGADQDDGRSATGHQRGHLVPGQRALVEKPEQDVPPRTARISRVTAWGSDLPYVVPS